MASRECKPEYLIDDENSAKYTVPCYRLVLLRRFSAKEDHGILTAVVMTENLMKHQHIGIENHVNFIHSKLEGLESSLAYGLVGLLNFSLMDKHFRIVNGKTQVDVYDKDLSPLPNLKQLDEIGGMYLELARDDLNDIQKIDSITQKLLDY
ncbi:MAG: hypothetical protein ACFFER_10480 [Candidatus Thorarchaeota archaeon]